MVMWWCPDGLSSAHTKISLTLSVFTMLLTGVLFFVVVLTTGRGKTLTWRLNTNYNLTSNWSRHRLPCSTETVVFQADLKIPVELPGGETTVRQLVLPADGELVLPKVGGVQLSERDIDGACDGGENVFERRSPGAWLSPASWSGTNMATPDLESVPCPTDTVVFSPGATFRVELPPFRLQVAAVQFKEMRLVREELDEFTNSEEGSRLLNGGPLEATGDECSDPAGCQCPYSLLDRWICPHRKCSQNSCLSPVKPVGNCCEICGAFLLYEFSPYTNLETVKRSIENELNDQEGVVFHVGRTMGLIQVVLVERDYTGLSAKLAPQVNKKLLSTERFGLRARSLNTSGTRTEPPSAFRSLLIFFGSLVVVLISYLAIIAYYHQGIPHFGELFAQRSEGRFVFARFENGDSAVHLGSMTPEPAQPERTTREFDNPMYSHEKSSLDREDMLFSSTTEEDIRSLGGQLEVEVISTEVDSMVLPYQATTSSMSTSASISSTNTSTSISSQLEDVNLIDVNQ